MHDLTYFGVLQLLYFFRGLVCVYPGNLGPNCCQRCHVDPPVHKSNGVPYDRRGNGELVAQGNVVYYLRYIAILVLDYGISPMVQSASPIQWMHLLF